jgi:hypothetical protein
MIDKDKKLGYFKFEESSSDNVVKQLMDIKSTLTDAEAIDVEAIEFLHDSDPGCDKLLSSMSGFIELI